MRGGGVEHRVGRMEARDGVELRTHRWTGPGPAAGRIVVVHGLGEHGGRYDELAGHLVRHGWEVRAWDLRGHGGSGGRRGSVERFDRYLGDVDLVVERAGGPDALFLLGHSMGGLLLLRWLQSRDAAPAGAVVSAPWLETAMPVPAWKTALARILDRTAPHLTLPVGSDATLLTRDVAKQREFDDDPLVHDRISARLHREVLDAQARALGETPRPDVPLLFLVPLADELVRPGVTLRYARGLAGDVRVEEIPDARHEPHQDLGRAAVFETVERWMREHAPDEPRPRRRVSS